MSWYPNIIYTDTWTTADVLRMKKVGVQRVINNNTFFHCLFGVFTHYFLQNIYVINLKKKSLRSRKNWIFYFIFKITF